MSEHRGRIYAAPHLKVVRIDRPRDTRPGAAVTLRGIDSAPLLFDHSGNLWASDSDTKGILRVPARVLAHMGPKDTVIRPEVSSAEGAGAGRVYATLLDREGNLIPDSVRDQPNAPEASTLVIASKLAAQPAQTG